MRALASEAMYLHSAGNALYHRVLNQSAYFFSNEVALLLHVFDSTSKRCCHTQQITKG